MAARLFSEDGNNLLIGEGVGGTGGGIDFQRIVQKRLRPLQFRRFEPNYHEYDFCMDTEQLKELQAPLKAKYRETPDAAVITLKADGALGDGITCSVQTGKALTAAGLHPATGGNGLSACSGDMLLEALVACAGVTLGAVATAIGVNVKKGSVHAEGDLDFRGTLGVAKDAPVGFKIIRLRFDLDTDATEEQIATLLKLTERYCVVAQSLRQPPSFSISRRA